MRARFLAAAALPAIAVLLAGPLPARSQAIIDTLREVLGPPVDGDEESRPRPRAQPAAPRAPTLDPADVGPGLPLSEVPVPTDRPSGAGDPSGELGETAPNDAPPAPIADDDPVSEDTPPAGDEAAEDDAAPANAPVPEPAPPAPATTDTEPSTGEPGSASTVEDAEAAPGDIPAEPSSGETSSDDDAGRRETDGSGDPPAPAPDTTPAPVTPAYVPPAEARTSPEPDATVSPPPAITPEEAVEAAAAIEDAKACEAELTERGVAFDVGESIAEESCGVLRPISITRLSSGIAVAPTTQFLCRTALAFDIWVSDGVVPAAGEIFDGASVEAINHASTYVCRSRASEERISEHARGSAIDIASFILSGGRTVEVKVQEPQSADDRFLAQTRRAACGPFTTVLGPGTDADHATHFHFDVAARNNGSTYCR